MTIKKQKKTKAELQRKIQELHAQLAFTYQDADARIAKASTEHMMASGVLLQLTALGGRELIPPVVIHDGLSPDTVEAIRRDLVRSYNNATAMKPNGAKGVKAPETT